MPTISSFYGITIIMYLRDKEHMPPHIHAVMQDFAAPFLLETAERKCGSPAHTANSRQSHNMFYKAVKLEFLSGTALCLTYQNGKVKQYDVASLFEKYPQLSALSDRNLFCSGFLSSPYGISWTDELDLSAETVYEHGTLLRTDPIPAAVSIGEQFVRARQEAELTQAELSRLTGIDQSDISKLERGTGNPSLLTLMRLAEGVGKELHLSLD